jgi:hypothetical protein
MCIQVRAAASRVLWGRETTNNSLVGGRRTSLMARGECCVPGEDISVDRRSDMPRYE